MSAPRRMYVFGSKAVAIYDPVSDDWSLGTNPPTTRYNFGVAVVKDTFYLISSQTCSLGYYAPIAVNEQYTPRNMERGFVL